VALLAQRPFLQQPVFPTMLEFAKSEAEPRASVLGCLRPPLYGAFPCRSATSSPLHVAVTARFLRVLAECALSPAQLYASTRRQPLVFSSKSWPSAQLAYGQQ